MSTNINLYPAMDEQVAGILELFYDPDREEDRPALYAAALIRHLQAENAVLNKALEDAMRDCRKCAAEGLDETWVDPAHYIDQAREALAHAPDGCDDTKTTPEGREQCERGREMDSDKGARDGEEE